MERYFERLPGLIDVKVLTTFHAGEQPHLLEPSLPAAFPICHLKKCTEDQLKIYSSLMEEAKTSILGDLDNTIEEINRLNQDCVANYATITKDIELIQQWMGQLQGAESELEQDIERCKANGQEITQEVNAKI
jgi:hypothetical protein